MVSINPFDRKLILVDGADATDLLQGLMSVDVGDSVLKYGLILTPKGRFRFDVFHWKRGEAHYLDHHASITPDLLKFLKQHRLRSDVKLKLLDHTFSMRKGMSDACAFCAPDPREASLGYRSWCEVELEGEGSEDMISLSEYQKLRVQKCIPELGHELMSDKTIPLEVGLDKLGAINFEKGCYLGQELQSRTKHVGAVRKGLFPVSIQGEVTQGDLVYDGNAEDRIEVGKITTALQDKESATTRTTTPLTTLGLALLRKDHVASTALTVSGNSLTVLERA